MVRGFRGARGFRVGGARGFVDFVMLWLMVWAPLWRINQFESPLLLLGVPVLARVVSLRAQTQVCGVVPAVIKDARNRVLLGGDSAANSGVCCMLSRHLYRRAIVCATRK